MLIALLAVLGVNLWVIVALLAVVLTRKRWVSHQPGAFKGAIRVIEGDVPGLRPRWKRGYGRWVRDILVWTKAPLLFRNELVLADGLAGEPRDASSCHAAGSRGWRTDRGRCFGGRAGTGARAVR